MTRTIKFLPNYPNHKQLAAQHLSQTMHLNHYLAKSGIASRRKTEELIKAGKITVNNKIVNKPHYQVKKTDMVKIKSQKVEPAKHIYILINKPKGVTTTCSDKFAKTTILDLIPKKIVSKKRRLYPVGRLDKNSTGLVVLTNDGKLCYKITHPKFETEKEYRIELSQQLKKNDLEKAKTGLIDAGELLRVKKIKEEKGRMQLQPFSRFRVIITEGKKRHLRRLFNRLGYNLISLKRIRIGALKLGKLKEGEFKFISYTKIKKYLNKDA